MKTYKTAKTNIKYLQPKLDNPYLDTSEQFLYSFFTKPQTKKTKEINDILNSSPTWPILYHLSPQRKSLLNWFPFDKTKSILEIGAGCGALTGLFCDKLKQVWANELSPVRARIIEKRFSDKNNLRILVGNIDKISTQLKFDYVSVIGVLEYSGRYIQTTDNDFNSPYQDFLKLTRELLTNNGHLLLAIENKLGIKYLAGGKEDHYANLFSSIENYPEYNGIRTFTKNELILLLKSAGYKHIDFYYPFPDYKLPVHIFTDAGLTSLNISTSSIYKIVDLSNIRLDLFSENIFAHTLLLENIADKFSNSFLIDAY